MKITLSKVAVMESSNYRNKAGNTIFNATLKHADGQLRIQSKEIDFARELPDDEFLPVVHLVGSTRVYNHNSILDIDGLEVPKAVSK